MDEGPVQIPLRRKYRHQVSTGKYRSSHNDSGKHQKRKAGDTQQSTAVLVLGPDMKRRIVRQEKGKT